MFFIPLDPVNLFANSMDTKQSYFAFLSRRWPFIIKWHKGHIWGLGGKAKTWRQGWNEFFAFPRMPIKLHLLPGFQSKYTLEFCPWVSVSLHAQSRNQLSPCLLPHSLVIVLFSLCFVIWVLCHLNSIKSHRFYLPLRWSCIYLLGLSRGTIFPLNKEHKEHSHFATTTFNSVKKEYFYSLGKLLCKNTVSCIIGSRVITSLFPR